MKLKNAVISGGKQNNLNKMDQSVVAGDPINEVKNKVIKDVSW